MNKLPNSLKKETLPWVYEQLYKIMGMMTIIFDEGEEFYAMLTIFMFLIVLPTTMWEQGFYSLVTGLLALAVFAQAGTNLSMRWSAHTQS